MIHVKCSKYNVEPAASENLNTLGQIKIEQNFGTELSP